MTQEVDITDRPFARKEAGPQSFEVNVVMEPDPIHNLQAFYLKEGVWQQGENNQTRSILKLSNISARQWNLMKVKPYLRP